MPNSKIPSLNLSDTLNIQRLRFNQLVDSIGETGSITTSASTIAGAINEHDAELGTITSGAMGTIASTVSGAIAELDSDRDVAVTFLGTRSLNTIATDLTSGINELKTRVDLLDSGLAVSIDSAFSLIGPMGTLTTSAKNTLVSSINEVHALVDQTTDFTSKFSVTDTGGDGSLVYDSATGVFTYTGPSASEVRAKISVTDAGGDGALSYNNTSGILTYTGPSATEVRAHISATSPITFTSGVIAANNATATTKGIGYFDSADFTVTAGRVQIKTEGVSNGQLENDFTVINGKTFSLGGGTTLYTDDIAEDGAPVNLWYTDTRARASISASSGVAYNSGTGAITHADTSALSGAYGQTSTEDGVYIKSVTVDANGHLTAVTTDDFDDRYNNFTYSHPNHTGHVTSSGDGATTIAAGVVNAAKLTSAVTLIIYNSAGTAVKTLYGAGS